MAEVVRFSIKSDISNNTVFAVYNPSNREQPNSRYVGKKHSADNKHSLWISMKKELNASHHYVRRGVWYVVLL
jgi:hypothetical protein